MLEKILKIPEIKNLELESALGSFCSFIFFMKSLKKDSKSCVSDSESSSPAVEMQKEPAKKTQRNMAMKMGLDIWELC